MPGQVSEATHFLNVDLDLYSKFDLAPMVAFMSKKVTVLYLGRVKGLYCAHLELGKYTANANSTIRGLCTLIRALPRAERKLWNTAKIRDFSVGVQAEMQPSAYDIAIESETVRAVSDLEARIVITIYAPNLPKK